MSVLDFVKVLQRSEPDIQKSSRFMNGFGFACIGIGLWNFLFPKFDPDYLKHFSIPDWIPMAILIVMSIIGILSLISSQGIKRRAFWGILAGQAALVIFILFLVCFGVLFYSMNKLFPPYIQVKIIMAVGTILVTGQFIVPAYFGIKYLGRIPARKLDYSEMIAAQSVSSIDQQGVKYKEALLPFGITGSFVLLILSVLIPVFIVQRFADPSTMPLVLLTLFAIVFLGPILYNSVPSSFENQRQVIARFTGGGSLFMFHGSWPFFKLMLYEDGIEIRVMFHRFFIPHDKMDDLPEKLGFFSSGILIRSDLSGVPSTIRFMPMGSKQAFLEIRQVRERYLHR